MSLAAGVSRQEKFSQWEHHYDVRHLAGTADAATSTSQLQHRHRRRRRPCCLSAASRDSLAGSSGGDSTPPPRLVTLEEVQRIARSRCGTGRKIQLGVYSLSVSLLLERPCCCCCCSLFRNLEITLKTLGPFYRIVCRDAASNASASSSSSGRDSDGSWSSSEGEGRVLAVTSGFVVPPPLGGLMHCDMLQVFTRGQRGQEGERTRGGVLGLGLLIGAATFAHGMACGCTKAEILAINGGWAARRSGPVDPLACLQRCFPSAATCAYTWPAPHAPLPQTTTPGTTAW